MAEYQKSRVHVKLLSFLKKTLNERENRRLCSETCEPCMLAKEESSQVGQKFVFLTTSFLYQIDYKLKNNPKVLCLLEDIVSAKQVKIRSESFRLFTRIRIHPRILQLVLALLPVQFRSVFSLPPDKCTSRFS